MTIRELIRRRALFVINSSGGKDSQAMTIRLARIIPRELLVIVHAHLPRVEWEGSVEHIEKYADGIPVYVTTAVTKDGEQNDFLKMVNRRGMFPDAQRRQCTSDLKRGPIDREIRRIAKERGASIVVSCQGMRAQESNTRAKLEVLKVNKRNTIDGRLWFDYLPIHTKTVRWVFEQIRDSGQKPFWTYAEGMTRKSCKFCIMASAHDLKIAARLDPALAAEYMETEERLGHTLQMSQKPLRQILAA
jgi:3'-phosphoadenosine 5'-phosphosulfate sulfotransferase (PAPS reductase)/FAD synthetase